MLKALHDKKETKKTDGFCLLETAECVVIVVCSRGCIKSSRRRGFAVQTNLYWQMQQHIGSHVFRG
jgi:hypothetical protein